MPSLLAITCMVGLAFVTRYSGMDAILGLSLTRTGWLYPFFGTLLGWLGVALTGTDAGSNALFGNLQKVTAEQLGPEPGADGLRQQDRRRDGQDDRRPEHRRREHRDAQEGKEAAIFKAVIWHSITLASLVGLLVMLYAYVFPAWIPVAP